MDDSSRPIANIDLSHRKMVIHFKDKFEEWQYDRIITIGGDDSSNDVVASIAVTDDEGLGTRVDVLSSAGNSCFQDLRCVDGVAYIGFGVYVFAVDIKSQRVARYRLDGYFGHMYDTGDIESLDMRFSVLVTSTSEVLALSRSGELLWTRPNLGVDGVVLHNASNNRLNGAGEWDPPGGWRKFSLLADSGAIV